MTPGATLQVVRCISTSGPEQVVMWKGTRPVIDAEVLGEPQGQPSLDHDGNACSEVVSRHLLKGELGHGKKFEFLLNPEKKREEIDSGLYEANEHTALEAQKVGAFLRLERSLLEHNPSPRELRGALALLLCSMSKCLADPNRPKHGTGNCLSHEHHGGLRELIHKRRSSGALVSHGCYQCPLGFPKKRKKESGNNS